MSKAIDDLMQEHQVILTTLRILQKIVIMIKKNSDVSIDDLNTLVNFLKEFADKCHHGKEEGFLFPAFETAGIPKENGPIGVMLKEHELGRSYIKQMSDSLAKTKADTHFVEAAEKYVTLLRSHIEKENNILFPMGASRLTAEQLDELFKKFEQYEEQVIGKGRHEKLHHILHNLENKFF
jgi:hemerythrin-like domain-containing protein